MYYIKQEEKCNVAKRFTVSHMCSSYNCKMDSIHQTDSIVANRACAVTTKNNYYGWIVAESEGLEGGRRVGVGFLEFGLS